MKNKATRRRYAAAILSKETKRFNVLSDWFNTAEEADKYGSENLLKYVILEEII